MKAPSSAKELQWSKALESVRKDVECFFGVLKGRFRVLKLPIQYREKTDIDSMFMTCCILHNIIHAYDGRLEWERDVDWAGVDGRLDVTFADADADFTLFGRQKAAVPGMTLDTEEETEPDFFTLRRDLVEHHDCAKQAGEVTWLRSASEQQ